MCSTQNTGNVSHWLGIRTLTEYLDRLLEAPPILAMLLYKIRVLSAMSLRRSATFKSFTFECPIPPYTVQDALPYHLHRLHRRCVRLVCRNHTQLPHRHLQRYLRAVRQRQAPDLLRPCAQPCLLIQPISRPASHGDRRHLRFYGRQGLRDGEEVGARAHLVSWGREL